ncbi:hypothetical protein JHK82_052987 [Glycine max]|nr:hypothetical protein JHK86_052830 [Glycine max]KAG5082822.1 hypothetical protein JHK84_052860 [Glycine max]KAG5085590.1 hypothetical protein JHK82_052987 [Glycine max]
MRRFLVDRASIENVNVVQQEAELEPSPNVVNEFNPNEIVRDPDCLQLVQEWNKKDANGRSLFHGIVDDCRSFHRNLRIRDEGDDQRIHPSMSRVKAPLDADVDPSFSSLATGHLEASIEPRAYAGDPYVIIHDSSTEIIIEVPNGGTVDESDTLVGEEDVGNRVEREVLANPEYDWVDEKALATYKDHCRRTFHGDLEKKLIAKLDMLHSSNILCSALLKVRNDDSGGLYMYVYIDFGFIVSWLSFSLKYIDLYKNHPICLLVVLLTLSSWRLVIDLTIDQSSPNLVQTQIPFLVVPLVSSLIVVLDVLEFLSTVLENMSRWIEKEYGPWEVLKRKLARFLDQAKKEVGFVKLKLAKKEGLITL